MISRTPLHLIHHTPLVRLDRLAGGEFNLYAKVEMFQPGFSIKDRAALQIISDAYESGRLVKGQLVVEMTSGNMGSGLAVVCRHYGNPFVAVMSEGNSPERARLLKALGAEVMLTPQVDGTPGMVTGRDIENSAQIARQYAARHNGFYVDQFNNPSSVKAHFIHTGPEIWDALPGTDAFVASVGSSGKKPSRRIPSIRTPPKCVIRAQRLIETPSSLFLARSFLFTFLRPKK
jgi:cysteine synthase